MISNGKIKILYIISSSAFSGAEKLLLDLCLKIDKEKFEIKILCLNENKKLESRFFENGFKIDFIINNKGYFDFVFNIYKFIKENNFQIVHTNLFGADIFGGIAAKMARVKKIVSTEHNINISESFLKHFLKSIILKICFNKVIAISDAVYKYVNKKYGINYKKIVKIYNGVDVDKFYKKDILKNDVVKIGVVGRLSKQKGHEVLIKALKKLDFDFKAYIIGDGEEKDALINLSKDLGIDDKIEFTGFVDDINKALEKIDVFVIPSLWEGFGLVAIEAMASGKIVIASKIDGLSDIIKDMENGILFEKGNSIDLADKINFVVENREVAMKIAENGYLYSKKFDIKNMVEGYGKIYLK